MCHNKKINNLTIEQSIEYYKTERASFHWYQENIYDRLSVKKNSKFKKQYIKKKKGSWKFF